jgi:predicted GIY-YIG superfamily endonuclease
MRGGWLYILASKRNGTLYTGVTADLAPASGSIATAPKDS